ncbi:oleosin Cor a 13-like [Bidens hawaiensis]|uniref:oleosin Cor a 13-like n=1 Tax=Bidens hawaiensis TaxID=980011 RepID=UPI0040497432
MTDLYNKESSGFGMQHHNQPQYWNPQHQRQTQNQQWSGQKAHQVVKALTAAAVGGSLLVLSGLVLAGTVIALTVATPVLVIFSPVLVPALITVFLLVTGFLTTGGFGVAAATVFAWMYRYVSGERPTGADTLDEASHKFGSKARDFKDRGEHAVRGGLSYGTGGGMSYGTGAGHHSGGAGIRVGGGIDT